MKKNIIGIVAILIALSASAFTTAGRVSHKKFDSLKWFTITATLTPTQDVAPSNATYLAGKDGETAPDEGCDGSGHQCVSGFDASQVNGSNMLIGTQTPVDVSSQKN